VRYHEAAGRAVFDDYGRLGEFERKLIRQRCDEGIARARAQGRQLGRPSRLDAGQKRKIVERYAAGESMAGLTREYSVGEVTIWRAIKAPFEAKAAA